MTPSTPQRGGFALGLIVGLLIGLALALIVALYVTKVPVPFINKVPQRTAEQDAAEVERNRQWDPNAALSTGKPAASVPAAVAPPRPAATASAPPARNPAAILAGQADAPPSTKPGADPFTYFVQAGAYAKPEDAEQQRARLAMMGFPAKVTEREQNGRTMYRVRLGPYAAKEEADGAQNRLQGAGVDAALVRVQR